MNDRSQASFDPRIADWLAGDANEAPEQALQIVLAGLPSMRQRHARRLPRRLFEMATAPRLAIGAAAVIAVVLSGAFVLGPLATDNVGGVRPTPSPSSSALRSKIPKTIGEVVMFIASPDAAAYIGLNPSHRLSQVLTALGKTQADLEVATGKRAGATPLLVIDALRVNGVGANAVLEAFETALADDAGISPSNTTIDRKEVVTWDSGTFYTAVYANDDVLYFVQSTDVDLVSRGLDALP